MTARLDSLGRAWSAGRYRYGCRRSRAHVRAYFLALFALTGCALATTGCRVDRIILAPTDTVFVTRIDSVPSADTLIITRTDTLVRTHVDTLYRLRVDTIITVRVDTLASPPVHDTTFVTVTRVDTVTRTVHDTAFVPRTDTLYLPSQVVHDTAWVYTQGQPTNPLAGGDRGAGVAYVPIVAAGGWRAAVYWHGHFLGIVEQRQSDLWVAYLYVEGRIDMPWRGDFPSLMEAVVALIPIGVTIGS